jgi:hypothetical protein
VGRSREGTAWQNAADTDSIHHPRVPVVSSLRQTPGRGYVVILTSPSPWLVPPGTSRVSPNPMPVGRW